MHFVWVNKHDSLYSGHGDVKDSVVCPACLFARSPQQPFQCCVRAAGWSPPSCVLWSPRQAGGGLDRLHVLTKAASCGQGREGLESAKRCAPEGRRAVPVATCWAGTARNEAVRPLVSRPSEWRQAQFGSLLSKKERSPSWCGSVNLNTGL